MSADEEGRDQARQRVSDELVRQGLSARDVARSAGVDFDTVADFLNGKRWSQPARRAKISRALGWVAEGIDQAARGEEPRREGEPEPVRESVGPDGDAPRVLLDIDPEVYEQMDPISRKRAKAEAEALYYRIAQEERRRADER